MRRFVSILPVVLFAVQLEAAVITVDLGNPSPGFNNGDTPFLLAILAAQAGQAAPFLGGIGNELFGPNFLADWSFGYGPIADQILGASITVGIADHDSAASGNQLGTFVVDGADLSTAMDLLFEGSGGSDNEYNLYTLVLPATLFASLADGAAMVTLGLNGPGLQTALPIFGGGVTETTSNGAFLISSTLTITTRDTLPPGVPEPATVLLLGAGIVGLLGSRRYFG